MVGEEKGEACIDGKKRVSLSLRDTKKGSKRTERGKGAVDVGWRERGATRVRGWTKRTPPFPPFATELSAGNPLNFLTQRVSQARRASFLQDSSRSRLIRLETELRSEREAQARDKLDASCLSCPLSVPLPSSPLEIAYRKTWLKICFRSISSAANLPPNLGSIRIKSNQKTAHFSESSKLTLSLPPSSLPSNPDTPPLLFSESTRHGTL